MLDSWDAAEDSDVEREKAKKAAEAKAKAEAAAKAQRKSRTQRIQEHQAANRRRKEEEDDEESSEEDESDKRRRLRKSEKDSDLKHAEELFGDLGVNPSRSARHVTVADPNNPAESIDLATLSMFNPSTKDQFSKLRDTLVPLLNANSKKPHYVMFMQEFTKEICKDLPSDNIKKIASSLTALCNEKLKEEKAADKGGKKKGGKAKASLNANRDISYKADTTVYDDGLEEYVPDT